MDQPGDGGFGEDMDEALPPVLPSQIELMGFGEAKPATTWRRVPGMVVAAWRMVWQASGRRGLGVALIQAVSGLGVGAQLLAGNELLTKALAARGTGESLADLAPQAVLVAALSATIALLGAVGASQQRLVGDMVGAHAYREIMATAAAVDLVQFEDAVFYDRLQRAALGGQMQPWMLTNGVLHMVSASLGVVGIAIALITLEPLLLLPAAIAAVPVWVTQVKNAKGIFRMVWGNTPDERERSYIRSLVTTRDSAKEVRAFNLTGYLRARHDAATDRILDRERREAWRQVRRSLLGQTGSGVAAVAGGGALLWLLVAGRLEVAAAVTSAIAMQQLRARLQGVAMAGAQVFESSLYLDDYLAFIADRPDGSDRRERVAGPFRLLAAERVEFTYPGSARAALHGVDVEVAAGEVVALVGENGSGKTTLAKLLCGLYEPTGGRVTWDGHDVAGIDPASRREHCAVIFQDFVHYALPARDNIGLGRHDRLEDIDAIRRAAEQASIDKVLDQLADGWDTVLGRQFDGGQDLSLGQWQRVALARAFFRDAPFLVLDEPTASLDARAEYRLFERLRTLARGRSVLLITHRFGNVRMADRIYVLHQGQVVEAGTHDELMALDGQYAELFNLQASQLLGDHTVDT